MKLSEKSIKKYYWQSGETLNHYMSMDHETLSLYHVSISGGNKKLGAIPNVSLLPITTCGNCSGCKNYCYAVRSALQYKNCRNAWAKNTAIAYRDLDRFTDEIANYIDRHKCKAFRFHVAGEIISPEYLFGLVWIATACPDCQFWTYTKRYDIVNKVFYNYHIPKNLSIMLSTGFDGCKIDNSIDLPEFRFIPAGQTPPDDMRKCSGDCSYCVAHNVGCPAGQSSYVLEH